MRKTFQIIAALVAVLALTGVSHAAGIFKYPALTTVPQQGCVPADVYGPDYTGNSQGAGYQTGCLTPGQVAGQAAANALNIYTTIPIGSVAYGSLGTDAVAVAGTIYWTSFQLPVDLTVGHIACLNGSTAATDKLLYGIYDSSGALLAATATAGTTATGTDAFQSLAIATTGTDQGTTATSVALKAGEYFIAWQTNGTTTKHRTVAASTYLGMVTDTDTGTFGTLTALTVPTTFTANQAPICYVTE